MATVTSDKYLLFWQKDSIYSNWHTRRCSFYMDNILFYNSEAAFMYAKAAFFGDKIAMQKIIAKQAPYDVKEEGRKVTPFVKKDWDEVCYSFMVKVLREKFGQNPHLRSALLSTGNLILVEASPFDKIWGIGLRPDNPLAMDPSKWKGMNLLGKALMQVRDELMNIPPRMDV